MLAVIESDAPPAHLLLGSDALRLVTAGREAFATEVNEWAELSRSTDLDDGAQIR